MVHLDRERQEEISLIYKLIKEKNKMRKEKMEFKNCFVYNLREEELILWNVGVIQLKIKW